MNVLNGNHPRVDFYGTDMAILNDGEGKNLWAVGNQSKPAKVLVPFENNQPVAVTCRFLGDSFSVDINNKPAFTGTYKAGTDFRLLCRSCDGPPPGATEFSDFHVEPLTSAHAASLPPTGNIPPTRGNIFTDGPVAVAPKHTFNASDSISSDVTWSAAESPYEITGTLSNSTPPKGKTWKISVGPGVEVRGAGTIHLTCDTSIEIKGEPSHPVLFRDITFDFHRNSTLTTEHAIFEHCTFRKHPRSPGLAQYSTKWNFDKCLLRRSSFPSLSVVEFGLRLTNCTLEETDLPEMAEPARANLDAMKYLRGEWDTIDHCKIFNCNVSPSAFWCAQSSNFLRCQFIPGEAFSSDTPTDVLAYIAETRGETPDQLLAGNPPKRAGLRITRATIPFPVYSFPGLPPVGIPPVGGAPGAGASPTGAKPGIGGSIFGDTGGPKK